MRSTWMSGNAGGEDHGLEDVEQKIRQALQSQADRVEPSDDAFLRITEAVAAQSSTGWKRLLRPGFAGPSGAAWSPLAFVTAVVAVAFGLTVTLLPPDDANLAAIGPSTPSIPGVGDGADESPVDEESPSLIDDVTDPGSTLSGLRSAEDLLDSVEGDADNNVRGDQSRSVTPSTLPDSNGYAPVRTTSGDAVTSLFDRLGLNGSGRVDLGQLEQRIESDRITLVRSGSEVEIARVDLDRVEDAFAVTGISTDTLDMKLADGSGEAAAIEREPGLNDNDTANRFGQSVMVAIDADDPVQSVVIEVVAAMNGRQLARTERSTIDPSTDAWSLETSFSFTGASRSWILATAYASDGEVVGVAGRPIEVAGSPDTADYTVVGLRPNDADGGLVVRDAPAGARVEVLDFGTSGIRRASVPAEVIDDVVWWLVSASDGTEGWVAAQYLMAVPELSSVELQRWARSVLSIQSTSSAPLTAAAQPELFGDRLTMGNILRPIAAENRFTPDRLLTVFAWNNVRNMPQAGSVSFTDFYDVSQWQANELLVGGGSDDAAIRRANLSHFGALPSFVVPIADDLDPVGSAADLSAEGSNSGGTSPGDATGADLGSGASTGRSQSEGSAGRVDGSGGVVRQIRFHIADGALPGEPTLPIIVGITVEETVVDSADSDEQSNGEADPELDDKSDAVTGGDDDSDTEDSDTEDSDTEDSDTEDGGGSQTGNGQSSDGSDPDDPTGSAGTDPDSGVVDP